jgi:hypothetical protein
MVPAVGVGRSELHRITQLEDHNGRGHLDVISTKWRVILKYILNKLTRRRDIHSSGSG